ncbi:hypothetical protein J7E88_12580 [Streptomyces sp. ISL-10]|uniref:hypothetical protein n=1 Tax=Streptomyces sp. ISL-10 TaxID=2819172 RepID=UPI001BE565F9|nr:hypothetical protein [Streptomyces sp. ISL-10]MBT2366121.1 hypothetical protein [Streptomyces sp. ISL-10]
MVAKRKGPSEREQAMEHRYADSHLDERGLEDPAGLVRRAGTQEEPGEVLVGSPTPADAAPSRGVPDQVRVRDRVGGWLVRALKRAVFCWLPPPRS